MNQSDIKQLFSLSRQMIYQMALPSGEYEYVSPSALHVFGVSPEKWLAQPLLIQQLIHPDWHSYFENEWQDLLKGKFKKTYEYKIVHPEKGERLIFQENYVSFDEQNRPVRITGLVSDITEGDLTNKLPDASFAAQATAGCTLSSREKQCLFFLSQGLRNSQIADQLSIKPVTVEYHLSNIRKKLDAKTREQALVIALKKGCIEI